MTTESEVIKEIKTDTQHAIKQDNEEDLNKVISRGIFYSETIITIGYIGFFTIFSQIKDVVQSSIIRGQIAYYFLFSLGVFIAFEIMKMFITSIRLIEKSFKEKGKAGTIFFVIIWGLTLLGTIIPAFLGLKILFPVLYQYLSK